MLTVNPQYITNSKGKKISVVIPVKEFASIIEELEELEDIKLYDAEKKRKQTFVDANIAFKKIETKRKKHV
jgi:gamma-glutamylcyclotransferase (GGCT)/AIG2-like uncharacterized protein YtfP